MNFNASVAASVGGVCSNGAEDGVGTALIAFSDGEASVMANQTICTFTLTHVGAAAGSFPYTIACAAADIDDNPTTCTPVSGNIVVSSGPPTAPTIAYAPTTLNFPAGTAIGQNQNLNVTLTAVGGVNGAAPEREADGARDQSHHLMLHSFCTVGSLVHHPQLGIHGTIEPETIGKDVSMGCIRMLPDDVALAYKLLLPGQSYVFIID